MPLANAEYTPHSTPDIPYRGVHAGLFGGRLTSGDSARPTTSVAVLCQEAWRHVDDGRSAEAELALRRALHAPPDDVSEYFAIAEIALAANRPLISVESYQRARLAFPDEPESHRRLTERLLALREFRTAALTAEAATHRVGRTKPMLVLLARALESLGEFERALTIARECFEGDQPPPIEALRSAARCLAATDAPTASLEMWQYVLRVEPGDVEARTAIALDAATRGQTDEALVALAAIEEASVAAPERLIRVAEAYETIGASDRAIACYEQALARQPNNVDALVGLADARQARNEPEPSLRLLQKAIELSPTTHRAHYLLARAYQLLNNPNRAALAFARAVDLDPDTTKTESMTTSTSGIRESAMLSGELAHFPLPDLLELLGVQRKTGVLIVSSSTDTFGLWLADGRAFGTYATRTAPIERALGLRDMLFTPNLVDQTAFERSARTIAEFATAPDGSMRLTTQVLEALCPSASRLVGTSVGTFEFMPFILNVAMPFAVDLRLALMEAMRRLDEGQRA